MRFYSPLTKTVTMAKNPVTLPHQSKQLFLTDGGLETTLIYLEGVELPYFAAFDQLLNEEGYQKLKAYYTRYLEIAKDYGTGFILESPTWRASPDWIAKIGYPPAALGEINEKAIQLMEELREAYQNDIKEMVISGCVGPRGDGYKPEGKMTPKEAEAYHAAQITVFARTKADIVTAITMNYVEEAIGIVRAANVVNLPVVISFTTETDGRLPTGMQLQEAIDMVDKSVHTPPLYYMLNCAHPTHFTKELEGGANHQWTKRIHGVRANSSCKSHAELDEATELDRGIPNDLGKEYRQLKNSFTQLNVFGGCCGTDHEHLSEIARQVTTT
jgi:S-methylmethionine-dependent homocysteine/selenocysteine methylase